MSLGLDPILKALGAISPILFVSSILIGIILGKLINRKRDSILLENAKLISETHRIMELKKRIQGLKVISDELNVSEEELEAFLLLVKASREYEADSRNSSKKSNLVLKNISEYLTNKAPFDPLVNEVKK